MDTRSDRSLETLHPGDHLCMFYERSTERVDATATYLRLGLGEGERCICLTDDAAAEQIADSLRTDGVDVAEQVQRDALIFTTARAILGDHPTFDPRRMVSFLERSAAEAALAGFAGLRVATDMAELPWNENGQGQLAEYELLVSAFCSDTKTTNLCQYDLASLPPETIEMLLAVHPTVAVGGGILPNPYCEPSDPEVRHDAAARTKWKLSQIEKASRAARMAQAANAMLTLELDRHRRTQQALAKRRRVELVMSEAARAFPAAPDRAVLFDAACRIAVDTAGFRLAWIDLLDPVSALPAAVSQRGADDRFLPEIAAARAESRPADDRTEDPVTFPGPFSCNDLEDGARALPLRGELLGRGIRSTATLPLRVQSRIAGSITLCSAEPNHFDEAELGWLMDLATDVSSALDMLEAQRQQQEVENALRQSERHYRVIFDSIADGMIIHDLTGRILEVNSVYCERLGYGRDELIGAQLSALLAPPNASILPERIATIAEQGYGVFESVQLSRKGAVIPVEVSSRLIEYEERAALVSISRDITERVQMEERLRRAQRLETAGRVAGQVAHDFNNLLGPMAAYPELIKMMLPADHEAVKLCDDMLLAATNMADINTDMLALSRRGLLSQEQVDVNHVVRQAVEQIVRPSDQITVVTDLYRELSPVSGSHAQLLRVISNLISNACDAMSQHGTLTIRTSNTRVDEPAGNFNRVEPGDYVQVVVQDQGCGIPKEMRDKIFDAFFTTKRASGRRGSGLGLTVVQALVEDHRGYVDLDSEEGTGTTFRVYLPAQQGMPYHQEQMNLDTGKGTILVVDDDGIQRQVLENLLTKLGYAVEKVASGEEALDFLREHSADLLILDMVMPGGMDGAETYRRIVAMRPGQKALVLSGFAETDRVEEARRLGAGTYLRKPMSPQQLASAVRHELDR